MSIEEAKQKLEEIRRRHEELLAEREEALAGRQRLTAAVMPEPASLGDVGREMAAHREKAEAAEAALARIREEERAAKAAVKRAEEQAAVARAKELQEEARAVVEQAQVLVDELAEKAGRLGAIGDEHHEVLSPLRQEVPSLEQSPERAVYKARDTIRTFVEAFRKQQA